MHKRNGFTLVELIIVIVVIGILLTLGGLAWQESRNNAKISSQKTNVLTLKRAIERYYADHGEYPFPVSCSYNGSDMRLCSAGELAGVLVPNYLQELPTDVKGQHFTYIATRPADPLAKKAQYGLKVYLSVDRVDAKSCKTGANIQQFNSPDPWWNSAASCEF